MDGISPLKAAYILAMLHAVSNVCAECGRDPKSDARRCY